MGFWHHSLSLVFSFYMNDIKCLRAIYCMFERVFKPHPFCSSKSSNTYSDCPNAYTNKVNPCSHRHRKLNALRSLQGSKPSCHAQLFIKSLNFIPTKMDHGRIYHIHKIIYEAHEQSSLNCKILPQQPTLIQTLNNFWCTRGSHYYGILRHCSRRDIHLWTE